MAKLKPEPLFQSLVPSRCPQVVQRDVLGRVGSTRCVLRFEGGSVSHLQALLEFFPVARGAEQQDDALERFHGDDPSSLPAPRGTPKLPRGREKQLAEGTAEVVRMIAQYQDLLWTVSAVGNHEWRGWRIHPGSRDRPRLPPGTAVLMPLPSRVVGTVLSNPQWYLLRDLCWILRVGQSLLPPPAFVSKRGLHFLSPLPHLSQPTAV